MKTLKVVLSTCCLLVLFCASENKDCIEASGIKACDDLESKCNGVFNRVTISASEGTEKCSCCE